MWKTAGIPRVVRVTKELAAEFFAMPTIDHDRRLNVSRKYLLREALRNGTLRSLEWGICFCEETGVTYRVNGKHTSSICSEEPRLPEIYATIQSHAAATLDDVVDLYLTYDSGISSKTSSDNNKAVAASIPELSRMSTRLADKVVAGLAYWQWGSRCTGIKSSERSAMLRRHVDFACFMVELFGEKYDRNILRQGVIAAIKATFDRDVDASREFWIAVRDETGCSPDLPDRKLARHLAATGVGRGRGSSKGGEKTEDVRQFLVKSIHAWNAWRKGKRPSELKYYAKAPNPMPV